MTQTIDPETGEIVEERALVLQSDVVRPLVTAEQAKRDWEAYIALVEALLLPEDYQKIGRKRFKKKSAWRKLGRAFRISDRIVDRTIERDSRGWPLFAAYTVEAEYPNGQVATGYHEAHLQERCCSAAWGRRCAKGSWEKHECCPPGCDGWQHWSHPGDISATAHTRAKNRAIADLIGAGEVSAEEMEGSNGDARQAPRAQLRGKPQPAGQPKSQEDAEREMLFGQAKKMWPDREPHILICQALNLPEVGNGALHTHWLGNGGTYKQAQAALAEVRRQEVTRKVLLIQAAEDVDAYGKLIARAPKEEEEEA